VHLPLPGVAAHDADVVTKHTHAPEGEEATRGWCGGGALRQFWQVGPEAAAPAAVAPGGSNDRVAAAGGGVDMLTSLPTHSPQVVDVLKGRHKALGALPSLPNAKVCSMRGKKER
jgi:hypothetical protein